MSQILTAFNNHFIEFVEDVKRVFPDDIEIATAANALSKLRKANPKIILMGFKSYVSGPYQKEIEAGELEFFLKKDYTKDVGGDSANNSRKDRYIKKTIAEMNKEDQKKVIKYLQNLTKLVNMYN